VDSDTFVAGFDYPMFVVTAIDPGTGTRAGCLVGFATQTSIDPFRFLVCLSRVNHTYRTAEAATHLAVHVLDESQQELAALFGSQTGDEIDKFARCAWHEGPERLPILDDCANWFVGRVVWRHDAGDHDAIVLEPVAAERGSGEDEFTFHRAKRIEPGHDA
jgi:flavin reductase (DIM6/NTAB) family NADH-FMN oxidoreductase RutF